MKSTRYQQPGTRGSFSFASWHILSWLHSSVQVQRYEGASTIYGPHTLSAYVQKYRGLARAIAQVWHKVVHDKRWKQREDVAVGHTMFCCFLIKISPYSYVKMNVFRTRWQGFHRDLNPHFLRRTSLICCLRRLWTGNQWTVVLVMSWTRCYQCTDRWVCCGAGVPQGYIPGVLYIPWDPDPHVW